MVYIFLLPFVFISTFSYSETPAGGDNREQVIQAVCSYAATPPEAAAQFSQEAFDRCKNSLSNMKGSVFHLTHQGCKQFAPNGVRVSARYHNVSALRTTACQLRGIQAINNKPFSNETAACFNPENNGEVSPDCLNQAFNRAIAQNDVAKKLRIPSVRGANPEVVVGPASAPSEPAAQ